MAKIKKLGLLDLDIFAFQSAAAGEEEVFLENEDSGFIECMLYSPLSRLFDATVERIDTLAKQQKFDEVVVCITDSVNWRKSVLPSYKDNRKDVRKPLGLNWLKQGIASHYESFQRPTLEADDVMGILATWDAYKPDFRKVIVSEDKDMKTIPAWIFNPAKDVQPWQQSLEAADRYHMLQTLTGDVTDGYAGCQGVGAVLAEEMLDGQLKFVATEHVFKSGARKGQSEVRWVKEPSESMWATVLSCYLKAGLTEADAIQQARVARICRASDYNFKDKEVKLWLP
tara:strand:+ start:13551 stop:14402 length:852 start_codon:yes stop_codon:yes gene_type:complete